MTITLYVFLAAGIFFAVFGGNVGVRLTITAIRRKWDDALVPAVLGWMLLICGCMLVALVFMVGT